MRAYDSVDIEDHTLRFTVQLLAGRVLRKCRPNEVPAGVVDLTLHAKDGKPYNWCLYLLNQLMDDCRATQERNQFFHYSWLLIIMAFVTWKEMNHSQFVTAKGECIGVRYVNLRAHLDLNRQHVSNKVFFTYYQQLCAMIANRPKITKDITNVYKNQVCFMANLHRIYLKPHDVETKDWYIGSYQMSQMDIEEIIKEWPEEWRNSGDIHSDSEEGTDKETDKGKHKLDEGKARKSNQNMKRDQPRKTSRHFIIGKSRRLQESLMSQS